MSGPSAGRRELVFGILSGALTVSLPRRIDAAPVAPGTKPRSLSSAQIQRIIDSLRLTGQEIPSHQARRLISLSLQPDDARRAEIERILDQYTLARVQIDQFGVGKATKGGAPLKLTELGWRSFLIRLEKPPGLHGNLALVSWPAISEGDLQPGIHDGRILGNDAPTVVRDPVDLSFKTGPEIADWMGYRIGQGSGGANGTGSSNLEYVVIEIYSQLGGWNTAPISFGMLSPQSYRLTDCQGFNAEFDCRAAATINLSVRDTDGQGTMASLLIYDKAGHLYPAPAHRMEPDLGYQPQIYRGEGETIRLPVGQYKIAVTRGPEYIEATYELAVAQETSASSLAINLSRWIQPSDYGWYSGDPHIHPDGQNYGGISGYGVTPETILRQVQGEGLCIGSVLIWACGYYFEKQFLTGHVYRPTNVLPYPKVQSANRTSLVPQRTPHNAESLVRYDAEEATFPAERMGHLVLLRLKNHDFPGATSIYDWPSWNLPVLKWARAQGAIGGYVHIGHGMRVVSKDLPNYEIPPMTFLGINEGLVDVTHGLVDFVAGCERSPVVDLNPWYHLQNCGFHIPMIGETDFDPGHARVGGGRTYVRLDGRPVGDAGYSAWVDGVKAGRLYFGDGRSHIFDFRVNSSSIGEGPLDLAQPGEVAISAEVACRLEPTPFDIDARQQRDNAFNYWHIERARIGSSRSVAIEVVENGRVAVRREIVADGRSVSFSFSLHLEESSWIALRILPSVHTTPIVVTVASLPVRASRRSAQWCLDCVELLWREHSSRIRASELAAAAAAWDHARNTYRQVLAECRTD